MRGNLQTHKKARARSISEGSLATAPLSKIGTVDFKSLCDELAQT